MSQIGTRTGTPAAPPDAAQIARGLQALLQERGFAAPGADPLLDALVHIAARQGEILHACLAAAPALHLADFGDRMASRRRPAQPAQANLVFGGAPAASRRLVVPARTQVASVPVGNAEPVVFETDEEIVLAAARPVQAWLADAGHANLVEMGSLLMPADAKPAPPLRSTIVRALHLAQPELFTLPGLREIELQFDFELGPEAPAATGLEWGVQTAQGWRALAVTQDETAGLGRSGGVRLAAPADWPLSEAGGESAHWLTLRAREPAALPRLRSLKLKAASLLAAQPLQAVCHGILPLDPSRDFHPFGERPRFGETFQLLSSVFALPGARVELHVRLNNPQGASKAPLAPVDGAGRPVINWEILTRSGFRSLVVNDGTRSFLVDGVISFSVPDDVAPGQMAGQTGVWLRARLSSGDWGQTPGRTDKEPPVPRAPSVHVLSVQAQLERGPVEPHSLVDESALTRRRITPSVDRPCALFGAADVAGPVLYLGFEGRFDAPGQVGLLLEAGGAATPMLQAAGDAQANGPAWQARTYEGWRELAMHDGSAGGARSGIVKLHLGVAPAPWPGCTLAGGAALLWLRLAWPAADAANALPPRLPLRLHLNAVAATQAQHLRDEVLGSSHGRPGQRFQLLRTPVVGALDLQVRESVGQWVRWQEVDDFAASGAADRHYTLDRQLGSVQFGDGRRGRVPDVGLNNVRAAQYAFGGGAQGNVAAGSLSQLRSAVPGVVAVSNPEPAQGGLDAQTPQQARSQASGWLRHRGRAVCADDYAELALCASPEVARAHCHAGRDLSAPTAAARAALQPGVLSLVLIPHSSALMPQPGPALLATVDAHLRACRLPAGRVVLTGPSYLPVAVRAEITAEPGRADSALVQACERAVARFLHPVHGAADGRGWASGRRPHRSMLIALLAQVDGVAVVRNVQLRTAEVAAADAVVAAGSIRIEVLG